MQYYYVSLNATKTTHRFSGIISSIQLNVSPALLHKRPNKDNHTFRQQIYIREWRSDDSSLIFRNTQVQQIQ